MFYLPPQGFLKHPQKFIDFDILSRFMASHCLTCILIYQDNFIFLLLLTVEHPTKMEFPLPYLFSVYWLLTSIPSPLCSFYVLRWLVCTYGPSICMLHYLHLERGWNTSSNIFTRKFQHCRPKQSIIVYGLHSCPGYHYTGNTRWFIYLRNETM